MPVSSGHLTVYSHDYSKQAPASQNYRHQVLKRLQPASAINQSPLKVLTLSVSPSPTLFGWKDGQKAPRRSRSSRRSSSSGLSLTSFALHQSLWHNKESLKFMQRLDHFFPHATVIYKMTRTVSKRPRCRRGDGGAGSAEAAFCPAAPLGGRALS